MDNWKKSLTVLIKIYMRCTHSCTWKMYDCCVIWYFSPRVCRFFYALGNLLLYMLVKCVTSQAFSSALHFEFTLWFLLNFVRMIPWIVIPLNNHNTSYWSNDRWRQNPATKQFFVFNILYSQLLFLSVQLNIEEMLEAIIYLILKQIKVCFSRISCSILALISIWSVSVLRFVMSHSVNWDCLFKY